MPEKTKRKQPYAFYFFLLSVTIIILSVWVLWFEFVSLRPWKSYQAQYKALKHQQLEVEYKKVVENFEGQELQQRYKNLQAKLTQVEEEFQSAEVQQNYKKIKGELDKISGKLKKNKLRYQTARGKYLEKEYLFHKHKKEKDHTRMIELEKQIEQINNNREKLLAQETILKVQLSESTSKMEEYIAEIQNMEANVKETKEKIKRLDGLPIEIKQVYLEDIKKADRCQSCHIGIDSPEKVSDQQPLAQHPGRFVYLENHPPEKFGCTVCHRGQGRATSSVEKAHGWVEYWPRPLLKGNEAQATCQKCHQDFKGLRGAPLLAKGQELLEDYGCYGCHKIAGYEELPKVGPPLSDIGEKVNYSWLVKWLKEPRGTMPRARMPNFAFSDEEAKAVADYLYSLTQDKASDHPVKEQIDERLYESGKAIYRQSRCSICHSAFGRGGAFLRVYAPDLSTVASKVKGDWLFDWIRDPKEHNPITKMSRYRFTDEEIMALADYIEAEFVDWDLEEIKLQESIAIENASIEKGAELIKNYGCFGCHDIKGMEEMKKIGPYLRRSEMEQMVGAELSSIGSKPMERIDFGRVKDLEKTRENYLMTKLKIPRIFRDDLRMPDYQLSEEEIEALTVLLLGFTPEEMEAMPLRFRVPSRVADYKPTGDFAQIAYDVKCLTCHTIHGKGGNFAPDLTIEGSKVKRQWLIDFLENPDIIRPLLKQMPQFRLSHQDQTIMARFLLDETETIIDYIKMVLVSEKIPINFLDEKTITEEEIEAGRELYYQKGCHSCHQIGEAGGAVGPDHTYVGDRLTPGYVFTYIKNPQSIKPEVVMPNFRLTDQEALNLTKFLMSLKKE